MRTPAPIHHLPLSRALRRELRSDHAGEAGAVQIYRGILAISQVPEVRRFAEEHLETERRHLAFFDGWLDASTRSRALPLWRAAGWTLGATAALFGPACVFRTIAAVESFVDGHYRAQLDALHGKPELAELAAVLAAFREEEIAHRDDAAERKSGDGGPVSRAWEKLIGAGSALGVTVARRL